MPHYSSHLINTAHAYWKSFMPLSQRSASPAPCMHSTGLRVRAMASSGEGKHRVRLPLSITLCLLVIACKDKAVGECEGFLVAAGGLHSRARRNKGKNAAKSDSSTADSTSVAAMVERLRAWQWSFALCKHTAVWRGIKFNQ